MPTADGKKVLSDANLFKEQLPCRPESAEGALESFRGSRKSQSAVASFHSEPPDANPDTLVKTLFRG